MKDRTTVNLEFTNVKGLPKLRRIIAVNVNNVMSQKITSRLEISKRSIDLITDRHTIFLVKETKKNLDLQTTEEDSYIYDTIRNLDNDSLIFKRFDTNYNKDDKHLDLDKPFSRFFWLRQPLIVRKIEEGEYDIYYKNNGKAKYKLDGHGNSKYVDKSAHGLDIESHLHNDEYDNINPIILQFINDCVVATNHKYNGSLNEVRRYTNGDNWVTVTYKMDINCNSFVYEYFIIPELMKMYFDFSVFL